MDSLDFYASIEELIPFGQQIQKLYEIHLKELRKLNTKSVLDIGCGNGLFVKLLNQNNINACGVDLSLSMVEKAKQNGINARAVDICDIKNELYDTTTAVFDVLNYIPRENISSFLDCVARLLVTDGYFLADINTYHGFADVADGDARFFDDDRDLFVSARFDGVHLVSEFTLYKKSEELYTKSQSAITQFYHEKSIFKNHKHLKLEKSIPIKLFSDRPDKELLVFRKN